MLEICDAKASMAQDRTTHTNPSTYSRLDLLREVGRCAEIMPHLNCLRIIFIESSSTFIPNKQLVVIRVALKACVT